MLVPVVDVEAVAQGALPLVEAVVVVVAEPVAAVAEVGAAVPLPLQARRRVLLRPQLLVDAAVPRQQRLLLPLTPQ